MATKKFKTPEEALEAIGQAADEVEKLMKSWQDGMNKDEGSEPAPEGAEPAPEADGIEDQGTEDPSAEGGAPAPEAAPEGAPAEGGEGDEQAAMAQHAAELSDEELGMMLEILQSEMEKRQASQEGGAPGEGAAPAPAPEQDKTLEMSMKSEFAKLSKSFKDEVESLKKSVDALKNENAALKKKISMPTTKPASANIKAVEKTPTVQESLNKSETVDYLLGEMRKGNKSVNSDLVAAANASRSDDDLQEVHRRIKYAGIELPKK